MLRELPVRVGEWMQRLEDEGVRGADLVFACVGPALEIYSRYSRVETAEGREVGLPEYLERVWEVVGREALEQVLGTVEAQARNGAAGALEEDSRLTALFLWTMQSTSEGAFSENGAAPGDEEDDATRRRSSGFSLPFDVDAPLRPASRHPPQRLGVAHHRDQEGRGAATARFRARQAAFRRVGSGGGGRRDGGRRQRFSPAQPVPLKKPQGFGVVPDVGGAPQRLQTWSRLTRRPRWTGCTPPCCCRLRAAARPCETCCALSRSAAPTSCV